MKTNRTAFTLIETLLVISFLFLLSLAIFVVYTSVGNHTSQEKTRLEITQNGRIFLDRLSRELRQTNEIVSIIPETKDDPENPPLNDITWQNGHDIETITYIRYYLRTEEEYAGQIWRDHKAYYFPEDPDTYVRYDVQNQSGESPDEIILDSQPIAEFVSNLDIWGSPLIYPEIELQKNESSLKLKTAINPRNI